MSKTVYIAWYGKTHDAFDEVYETIMGDSNSKAGHFPVYGVAKKDKVFADKPFDNADDALRWVVDQLRPMCSVGKDGKTNKGMVYSREANRRAFIVGQAQVYVINDRKSTGTKVYAAGGWRAKKI